jgi:uncharacterized protein (PEP-CTERM system associated)
MQWKRESRLLKLEANYSEAAQTIGDLGTLTAVPATPGTAGAGNTASTASVTSAPAATAPATAGTDAVTNAVIADNGGVGFVRASFQPFLNKELDLSMTLTGQRTTVQLMGVSTRRQYLATGGLTGAADEYLTGRVLLSRKITVRDTFDVSAMYERADLREGLSYHGWLYALGMTHELTPKLTSSLTGTHVQRSGDSNYAANIIALTLKQSF